MVVAWSSKDNQRRIMSGKKVLSTVLCTLTFFAATCAGFAEDVKKSQVQKAELTFSAAYELLLNNNNALKAASEEINVKKYEKRAAAGEFFPKVGLNSTFAHLNDDITVKTPPVSIGPITANVPAIGLQEKNLWFAGLGATWNIFTGGKILALNSAARAKLYATNEKYRGLTNSLTVELVKRYYGLRFAEDVVSVAKQVEQTAKKHLEDAEKLEREGLIAKSERLHAEVAYRRALRDYNTYLKDADICREALVSLIKADDVDVSGVNTVPVSGLFLYEKNLPTLEEIKQKAVSNNPKLKQLDAKSQIAKAAYRAKAADYSPVLSVFAYDVFAKDNLSAQVPNFAVGASANWKVFDGLSRYNNLKAADSFKKQVRFEQIDAKNNIEALATKHFNELQKYREQYESTEKELESANEALRTATLSFKEGMGTSLQVTDARTALAGVKIQRLKALYDYDVALAQILAVCGNANEITEYVNNSKEERL